MGLRIVGLSELAPEVSADDNSTDDDALRPGEVQILRDDEACVVRELTLLLHLRGTRVANRRWCDRIR